MDEITESCLGKMLDSKKNKGEYQPYLANINVRWGSFDLNNLSLMRFEPNENDRYGIKYGDLIMCEGGEPGRCAIWRDELPNMKIQKALHRIRPNTNLVDVEYLYYWFLLSGKNDLLRRHFTETTIKHLPGETLKQLVIDLPDMKIQKNISTVLRSIDKKITVNEKINDNLEQQIRSLFRVRFTDNPALEKMKQVPLSDLCQIVTKGTTPTTLGKPFVKSGINFIKAESILDSHAIDKSKFAFIDEETNTLLKRSVIKAGDIVFTIAGTLGRFALIDKNVLPANTNQAVAIIRADVEKVLPEYIYTCFIGEWHNHYYTKRVQQAVQANLSLTTIKSLPIPLLDESEMVNFTKLIIPLIKMIKQNEVQNETLTLMRDTLLPKLMSGEIDVSAVQL